MNATYNTNKIEHLSEELDETWNLFFGDADETDLDAHVKRPAVVEAQPAVTVELVGDIADPDTNPQYVVTINSAEGYSEIVEALQVLSETQPSTGTTEKQAIDEYMTNLFDATGDKQAVRHGLLRRLQLGGDFFVGPVQGSEQDDSGSDYLSLAGA